MKKIKVDLDELEFKDCMGAVEQYKMHCKVYSTATPEELSRYETQLGFMPTELRSLLNYLTVLERYLPDYTFCLWCYVLLNRHKHIFDITWDLLSTNPIKKFNPAHHTEIEEIQDGSQ